jgi:hypothetical protein
MQNDALFKFFSAERYVSRSKISQMAREKER